MKFLGEGGMDAGIELRSQQGTDRFFSSVLSNNALYRVFVPLIQTQNGDWTVAAATVVGRNLDYDALGSSFVSVDYALNDLDQVYDISGLDRLQRISSVLYEAAFHRETVKAERDAKQTAEDLNVPVDTGKLAIAKQEIEQAYHGARVNGQRVMPSKKMAVGPVSVVSITDVAFVKISPDGTPDNVAVTRASLPLSSTKCIQFKDCLRNITERDKQRGYMELSYNYEGMDKSEAGRAAKFIYVDEANSLENTAKGSDWWTKYGGDIKRRLLYTQREIAAKNRNIAFTPKPEDVFLAFKNWVKTQVSVFPYVDMEATATKSAAKFMLEYDVVQGYDKLREGLLALAAQTEDKPAEEEVKAEAATEAGSKIATAEDAIATAEQVGADAFDEASGSFGDDEVGIL